MNNDLQTLRWTCRWAIQKSILTSSSKWGWIYPTNQWKNDEETEEPNIRSWIATVGLAGTVVSLHDQSIARAVEKMQAFPPHLLGEAMRELGNIMQNRSPTTVTYPDVSTGFLAPMRFFHKFISTSGKDIGSHSLTHYNDFHNAKACGKEKMKSYARAPTQPVTRRPRLHSSNFRSCAQRWDRC